MAEINTVYPTLRLSPNEVSFAHCGLVPFGETATATELSFGKESRLVDHRQTHNVHGLVSLVGIRFTMARVDAARAIDMLLKQSDRAPPAPASDRIAVAGWRDRKFRGVRGRSLPCIAGGRCHEQPAGSAAQSWH